MVFSLSPVLGIGLLLLFSTPSAYGVIKELGLKRGTALLLGLLLFWSALAFIGIKSGFPFGYFWYGDVLQPKIMQSIPLFIGLLWLPVFLGASAIANRAGVPRGVPFMLTVALLMLAASLILDPVAVAERLWIFRNGGEYLHVPVANFMGWLFAGSLAAFLFPTRIRSEWAVGGFLLVIIAWTFMAILHGFVLPAILGLLMAFGVSWFDLKKHGWRS